VSSVRLQIPRLSGKKAKSKQAKKTCDTRLPGNSGPPCKLLEDAVVFTLSVAVPVVLAELSVTEGVMPQVGAAPLFTVEVSEHCKLTVPAKPLSAATCNVAVPLCPGALMVVPEAGGVTENAAVAVSGILWEVAGK
jgi:hypothetical protein